MLDTKVSCGTMSRPFITTIARNMMKKQMFALMGVALLTTVVGCQASSNNLPSTQQTSKAQALSTTMDTAIIGQLLQSYDWQLVSVTDKAGKPAAQALFAQGVKPLVAMFDKDSVRLKNTCNHMWGSYQLVDGRLVVGDMASTMMLCEPALMAVDSLAPSVITGIYTINKPQGKLPVLVIESGQQISQFQAIQK